MGGEIVVTYQGGSRYFSTDILYTEHLAPTYHAE